MSTSPRRHAREAALRILYFWEIGGSSLAEAATTYFLEHDPEAPDSVRAFASELTGGVGQEIPELDAVIGQHSQHWRVERLAVIDRLILRLAIWEMRHAPETPPAVAINEAVELARTFSTDDSVRFVNGVLDAVRRTLTKS